MYTLLYEWSVHITVAVERVHITVGVEGVHTYALIHRTVLTLVTISHHGNQLLLNSRRACF